jgi:hypothetical protein
MAQIRSLLWTWDAIGVRDLDGPEDEYHCMIGPLLHRLHEGLDVDALTAWIAGYREEHIGLPAHPRDDRALAGGLVALRARLPHLGPS